MIQVSTDIEKYIDEDYTILEDSYVRDMIMACGWEYFEMGYLTQTSKSVFAEKRYIEILDDIVNTGIIMDSYIMVIYTIVRFLYPQRKVIIVYKTDQEEPRLELYYVSRDWNGQIDEGYVMICTVSQLLTYMSAYEGGNYAVTMSDLVKRVPEVYDHIYKIYDNHMTLDELSTSTYMRNVPERSIADIIISMNLMRQYPIYKKIFNRMPPACKSGSRRYIDSNSDSNFIFQ
jgi:hypothetical protein